MCFYDFMKRYRGKNTARGDFANDMEIDKSFPRNEGINLKAERIIILEYLKRKRACNDCIEIFKKCWRSYVTYMKHR